MSDTRKKEHYEVGDVLCDMHDGFKYLPDNLAVVKDIRLRDDNAQRMLLGLTGGVDPGNKFLVVVGSTPNDYYLVAAFSYDDRVFGMIELQYLPKPEKPSEGGNGSDQGFPDLQRREPGRVRLDDGQQGELGRVDDGPETIEQARARVGEALAALWDAVNMPRDETRPGNQRKYVFDFEDGIHILVTRELYPSNPCNVVAVGDEHVLVKRTGDPVPTVVVHVSASLLHNCSLTNELKEIASSSAYKRIPGEPDWKTRSRMVDHLIDLFAVKAARRIAELLTDAAGMPPLISAPTYVMPGKVVAHWLILQDDVPMAAGLSRELS